MIRQSLSGLILTAFLFIVCSAHAEEVCYPDQYPFDVCVDVPVLQWDEANSLEELDTNSSGMIFVIGGRGPYAWTVSGQGFYLDPGSTLKTLTTDSPAVNIYAIEACGAGFITVTDTCGTTLESSVRSDQGYWELQGEELQQQPCPYTAPWEEWEYVTYGRYKLIKGENKIEQQFGYVSGSGYGVCDTDISYGPNYCIGHLDDKCLTPPPYPYAYEGCITDWCTANQVPNATATKQCGGYCYYEIVGSCGNNVPSGPLVMACGDIYKASFISIYKWQCN